MNIGTWCFNIAAFYPAKQRYSFFSICQKDQKGIFVSQGTAFPSEELVLQGFILILILQEKKKLSIYLNFACFDSFYVGLMVQILFVCWKVESRPRKDTWFPSGIRFREWFVNLLDRGLYTQPAEFRESRLKLSLFFFICSN